MLKLNRTSKLPCDQNQLSPIFHAQEFGHCISHALFPLRQLDYLIRQKMICNFSEQLANKHPGQGFFPRRANLSDVASLVNKKRNNPMNDVTLRIMQIQSLNSNNS